MSPRPYYQDEHVTIWHGDCIEVLAAAGNDTYGLALTDPPYGIGVQYGQYDDLRLDYWAWMAAVVRRLRSIAKVVAFTHRVEALRRLEGWDWSAVWTKPASFTVRMGNSPVVPHWEPILLYGIHAIGASSKGRSDVFSCQPVPAVGLEARGRESWRDAAHKGHPTPKPVELFRLLIETFGQAGGVILDPFMGSGTTLRAAKDLGRKAVGIEVEERYCEIAAKRCAQEVLFS